MNHALLFHDTDSSEVAKSKTSGLRVNQPGDLFEREADRIAETVTNGGYVSSKAPAWSLGMNGGIQRQSVPPGQATLPQPEPVPNNYGDALSKVAEAFLQSKAGQDLIKYATEEDPLGKAATDFVQTPAGIAVTGVVATGAVAALAATHRPLPLQIPAIPLDKISSRLSGLKLKLTYEGPVDRPTQAMVSLSYEGKSDKKKKANDSEKYRAETSAIRADQDKFRAGMEPKTGPVADQSKKEGQWIQDWALRRVGTLPGSSSSGAFPVQSQPQLSLHMRDQAQPSIPETTPDAKKEDLPVQRKAVSSAEIDFESADVDSVLRSSSRPLDRETRRFMEARIGFDFEKVRIHTDARSASSAKALGASAYTVGNDVVFAAGQYSPQSNAGRRLLAHELTHVVQQSSPAQRPHTAAHAAPRRVQRFLDDVKGWLLGRLKQVKGYPLFCVVIGKDLVTGEIVDQNATNLTQGVLGLFDGGPALFEKLKKAANAIDTAYHWVLAQLQQLNLTPAYFSELIDRAVAAVDKWHLIDSWDRVLVILKEPLDKLIELASRLAKAVLDFILKAVLENFPLGKKVYELFKKAGSVITQIAANPISFAKNLFAAITTGFKNFGLNILTHLGDGLKRWIFEEIGLPDLKMPKTFDFMGILQMVLRALKLTYEQRRPQIVKKLTDRLGSAGEQVVYFFETAVDIFKRIKNEGFIAVWDEIKKRAEAVLDSLLDQARNWVVEKIVTLGLAKVAALATPIGDAIEIIAGIYETIKFFIEKATQFVELIDSIVNSLADMVAGKIDAAAKRVEDTLAAAIPLLLRFLAGLLHLDGIGEAIRKIIESIRAPIDKAIDKVLDFVVDRAMPVWEVGKEAFLSKIASFKEWWNKPKKFHSGEEEHTLSVEGDGAHPEVFVQSNKTSLQHFLTDIKATPKQTADILALAKQLSWRQGELQKPADDQKGGEAYEKLAQLLDHLKAREAPRSQINYPQAPHSLGGGLEADAYLSSSRDPGTEPNDTDPPIWNDLGYLRDSSQKFYVRGHLLSMRLGGLGLWKNMMPITNTVNQRMNSQVENPLKQATVPGSNRFFHYNIKAKYADTVLPPSDPSAPAAHQKQRAVDAEKRLLSLSWTVKPAEFDKDAGGWKETSGKLLKADGSEMDARVAQGDFTPPSVR